MRRVFYLSSPECNRSMNRQHWTQPSYIYYIPNIKQEHNKGLAYSNTFQHVTWYVSISNLVLLSFFAFFFYAVHHPWPWRNRSTIVTATSLRDAAPIFNSLLSSGPFISSICLFFLFLRLLYFSPIIHTYRLIYICIIYSYQVIF